MTARKKSTSSKTRHSPVVESISLLCNLRFTPPFFGEQGSLEFGGDFDLDAPWDGVPLSPRHVENVSTVGDAHAGNWTRDHWPIEPRVLRVLASVGSSSSCGHDSLGKLGMEY